MTLAHFVYRIASDPAFAAQFAKEPHTTLSTSGVPLNEHATAVVLSVLGNTDRTKVLCSLDQATEARNWYTPPYGM